MRPRSPYIPHQTRLSVQDVPSNKPEWSQENEEMRRLQIAVNALEDDLAVKSGNDNGGLAPIPEDSGSVVPATIKPKLSVELDGNTISKDDVKILDFINTRTTNVVEVPVEFNISENVYQGDPRETRVIIEAKALIPEEQLGGEQDLSVLKTVNTTTETIIDKTTDALNFVSVPMNYPEGFFEVASYVEVTADANNPNQANIKHIGHLDYFGLRRRLSPGFENSIKERIYIDNDGQQIIDLSYSINAQLLTFKLWINGVCYERVGIGGADYDITQTEITPGYFETILTWLNSASFQLKENWQYFIEYTVDNT